MGPEPSQHGGPSAARRAMLEIAKNLEAIASRVEGLRAHLSIVDNDDRKTGLTLRLLRYGL